MTHAISIVPGAWEGHRKAVCWPCNWYGPSHASRRMAERDAEEHVR